MEYEVSYHIDVDGDSFEQAARTAIQFMRQQRDPTVLVREVFERCDNAITYGQAKEITVQRR